MHSFIMDEKQNWSNLPVKEKLQYSMAIAFCIASIALAFLAFILLLSIPASVITMSSLFGSFAMGIMGVSLYFKTQMMEINTKCDERLKEIDKEISRFKG